MNVGKATECGDHLHSLDTCVRSWLRSRDNPLKWHGVALIIARPSYFGERRSPGYDFYAKQGSNCNSRHKASEWLGFRP